MQHNYRRFAGESEEELIYRICQDKEKIGTWENVAHIINDLTGNDYGESTYRKKYSIFQKMLHANEHKFIDDEQALSEIKAERIRLEKEKIQLRDERNEYKRLIREDARREGYLDQIKQILSEYAHKTLDYDFQINNGPFQDNDLVISLFDIHGGLVTKNFFNTYNEEIFSERLKQYLNKIFIVQERHGSQNAYVILSELISGLIHSELRIESNQNIINQFLMVMDYISEFLINLSSRFSSIHVYVCPGNHSRIEERKEASIKGENLDHLAIPYLKAILQNIPNVQFYTNDIEESIAMFSIRGHLCISAHGDKDSPESVVQKMTMLFGHKPDFIFLGHRHTNSITTVYDTKVIQSGCLSGNDNFCMDKRLRNRPEQTISVITSEGLDCIYDVKF